MLLALALGDAATWVAAIGTVGTLSVSLFLLYRANSERRRDQARRIAAWMEEMTRGGTPPHELSYLIRNQSDEPVYDVRLRAPCGVRGTFVRWLGTMGPGEARRLRIKLPGYPRADEYPPDVSFRDSAGVSWIRSGRGRLSHPSAAELERHAREDAGAYDEHPTLRLDEARYPLRGDRVE